MHSTDMEVVFPGGNGVDVLFRGFRVQTDQSGADGSPGSAPEPFELLFAAAASCSGWAAATFCRNRNISTEGLSLLLRRIKDPEQARIKEVEIEVILPPDFPEKYRTAILNSIGLCSVKKAWIDPPRFRAHARKPDEPSPM